MSPEVPNFMVNQRVEEMARLRLENDCIARTQRKRNVFKAVAGLTLAGTVMLPSGTIGLQAAQYSDVIHTQLEEELDNLLNIQPGPIIEDFDGCPDLPIAEPANESKKQAILLSNPQTLFMSEEEATTTLAREEAHNNTQSAASNTQVERLDILVTAREIASLNKYPVLSYTSLASGIRVNLYSDKGNAFDTSFIDTETLDQILHANLDTRVTFKHKQIDAAMKCISKRVLIDREFAGYDLNIYIPSDHSVCLKNLRKQRKLVDSEGFCDSRAGTLAEVKYGIAPGRPLYEQGWIVVSPARVEFDGSDTELAKILFHESAHFFTQKAGVLFKLERNEALVKEIERDAWHELYSKDIADTEGNIFSVINIPAFLTYKQSS